MRLGPGESGIIGHVPAGRLTLDGNRVVPIAGSLMRSRQQALHNGMVVVTVTVDANGKFISEPVISTVGLLENDENDIQIMIREIAETAVKKLPLKKRREDEVVHETIRIAVRRAFRETLKKKPVTLVHVTRIDTRH